MAGHPDPDLDMGLEEAAGIILGGLSSLACPNCYGAGLKGQFECIRCTGTGWVWNPDYLVALSILGIDHEP